MLKLTHELTLNPEFQRHCDSFISRHVYTCASSFISNLMQSEDAQSALDIDSDDLYSLAYRPLAASDYSDQCDNRKVIVSRQGDNNEPEYQIIVDWDDRQLLEDIAGATYDSELEAWEAIYEELGQDSPDATEALEYWLISDNLARWLNEHGESINSDIAGFTIWGRTTSGQAISIDSVICSIVWNLASDEQKKDWLI